MIDPVETVETVGLFALAYDAMFNLWRVGRRPDDIRVGGGTKGRTVSLVTLFAASTFDDWDWAVVQAHCENEPYGRGSGRDAELQEAKGRIRSVGYTGEPI